ncbi:MAG TPA: hypothetical protein VI389_02480 [Geobacteraceae bacterium]
MRALLKMAFLLLPLYVLTLSGCGGNSPSGGSSDPFGGTATTGGTGGAQFSNVTTAGGTGVSGISLALDRTTVDANNGQVLATATLLSNGAGVPGSQVTFSIVAPTNGPATIDPLLTTVSTDSNGKAVTRVTTGSTNSTTNVIVKAAGTINGQAAVAFASFQIVRGSGVIAIGDNGMLPKRTQDVDAYSTWTFEELIAFQLTDSNGNPRVGVPVTLSKYSQQRDSIVVIDYLSNPVTEPNQQTVTTDSSGRGIFNVSVTMTAFGPGLTNSDAIVYKAVTNDPTPVVNYVGQVYSLTSKVPVMVIAPTTASFSRALGITTLDFNISGGITPYHVASANSSWVTATLSAPNTVTATLQAAAPATGSTTISVTDSSGQTATATINW